MLRRSLRNTHPHTCARTRTSVTRKTGGSCVLQARGPACMHLPTVGVWRHPKPVSSRGMRTQREPDRSHGTRHGRALQLARCAGHAEHRARVQLGLEVGGKGLLAQHAGQHTNTGTELEVVRRRGYGGLGSHFIFGGGGAGARAHRSSHAVGWTHRAGAWRHQKR